MNHRPHPRQWKRQTRWLRRDRRGWTGGETKYETRRGTRVATVRGTRIGSRAGKPKETRRGGWEGLDVGFLPVAGSVHRERHFCFVPREHLRGCARCPSRTQAQYFVCCPPSRTWERLCHNENARLTRVFYVRAFCRCSIPHRACGTDTKKRELSDKRETSPRGACCGC